MSYVANDTSGGEAVTITTANTSNPRIDVIVCYVNMSATFSTSPVNSPGAMVYAAVAGTPASSPAVPSGSAIQTAIGASNPYIILAQVAVAANVTSIVNSYITDVRPWALVTAPNISTVLGYAQNTSGYSTQSSSTISTGLGVACTIPVGTTYVKITGYVPQATLSAANSLGLISLWQGGSVGSLVTQLNEAAITTAAQVSDGGFAEVRAVIENPTPGSTAFTLAYVSNAGAITLALNATTTSPIFVLVEV